MSLSWWTKGVASVQFYPLSTNRRTYSPGLDRIIFRLYNELNDSFCNPSSPQGYDNDFMLALRIMNTPQLAHRIVAWSKAEWPTPPSWIDSQEILFSSIMESSMGEMMKWSAARLTLRLACHGQSFRSANHLIEFLDYHFLLEKYGEDHAEHIANAFQAFAGDSLRRPIKLHFIQGDLLEGIQRSVRPERPTRLRQNAEYFIYWIGRRRFDDLGLAMEPRERAEFCSDFPVLGVDMLENPRVIFRMANSDVWRPHLSLAHWRALERLHSRCPELLLDQCLGNRTLIPSLWALEDGPTITKLWLRVVWRNSFEQLGVEIVDNIRWATLEILLRDGDTALDGFLALITPDQNQISAETDYGAVEHSVKQRSVILNQLWDEAGRLRKRHGKIYELESLRAADRLITDLAPAHFGRGTKSIHSPALTRASLEIL